MIVDANGVLYSVTSQEGASTACGKLGCGTLFESIPPVPGEIKHDFAVLDQQASGGGLTADGNGVLYCTTGTSAFMVTGSGIQP